MTKSKQSNCLYPNDKKFKEEMSLHSHSITSRSALVKFQIKLKIKFQKPSTRSSQGEKVHFRGQEYILHKILD